MKTKENYAGIKGTFRFVSKIISWTLLTFLMIIALFLAYYLISTKLSAMKGERFEPVIALYNVLTESMEPNINPQDVVVTIKEKDPLKIRVGDVITFYSTSSISRGMIITHRVVEVVTTDQGIAYKTKGDNNSNPDTAPAEFHNVIGKVVVKIPNLGYVQRILASKAGWLIIIVIPALFIIISDIVKLFHLNDIKKKITINEQTSQEQKRLKEQAEERRKKILKQKLKLEKNIYEPDPLPIQKPTRIVVGAAIPIENKMVNTDKKSKKKNRKRN